MTETSSPSAAGGVTKNSPTPAVTARPARTKPGVLGVLTALGGLVIVAAGIVGVAVVAWPLVVLTSEQQTTPIVNTGSLH